MDQEVKDLLQKNLEVAKQNNRMLKKMRRGAIIGFFIKVIIWAFVLGAPVFLYFNFFAPRLQEVIDLYRQVQGGAQDVQQLQMRVSDLLETVIPGGQ